MKKIVIVVAIIFTATHLYSQAADRKITIQSSPFLLFSDIFVSEGENQIFTTDWEVQYKVNKGVNLSATLSVLAGNRTITNYNVDYEHYNYEYPTYDETIVQINLKPMLIHRPFETGLKGFFLGFYPSIGFLYLRNDNDDSFHTEAGFGINIGYKWVFRTGFTMQVGSGIGKTFSFPKRESEEYAYLNSDGRITISHTDIHLLDFKIGYSF